LPTGRAIRLLAATIMMLLALHAHPLTGQVAHVSEAGDTTAGVESAGDLNLAVPADAAGGGGSRIASRPVKLKLPDLNERIYYKNKLELSLESGWLPINVPFVWDFLVGSPYTIWPLPYTLQPNILSLRWQMGDAKGPSILRGNWDFTFSASYTNIPRGPETRYFAFDYGIRRNFIRPRWRVVPYYEMRGGLGNINAKGPDGILFAQGQNFTFTYTMGAGARYNFNPRWGVSAGLNYMHVSNFYQSEPAFEDYGINVYGPMVGINMRLGKEKR
jgi:Lipid A 3-O-deacylase (PagL)